MKRVSDDYFTGACKHGHKRTEANTRLIKDRNGYIVRRCRTCHNEHNRNARRGDRVYLDRERQRRRRDPGPCPPGAHGTTTGYDHHRCRCPECSAYNSTRCKVYALKRKAREMGVKIPRGRNEVQSLTSLDAVAEARFGMDRVLVGTTWDDPTAEAALAAFG